MGTLKIHQPLQKPSCRRSSTHELEDSNSTTSAFLGNRAWKSWMSSNSTNTSLQDPYLRSTEVVDRAIRPPRYPKDDPPNQIIEEAPHRRGADEAGRQASESSTKNSSSSMPSVLQIEPFRFDAFVPPNSTSSTSSVPSPIQHLSPSSIVNALPSPNLSEDGPSHGISHERHIGALPRDIPNANTTPSQAAYVPSRRVNSSEDRPDIASASTPANTLKRTLPPSNEVVKRLQPPLRGSPDPDFWSKLGNAFAQKARGSPAEFEAVMAECRRTLTRRLDIVSGLSQRGRFEKPRLEMLQTACEQGDCSYLLIHQIYCCSSDSTAAYKGGLFSDTDRQKARILRHSLAPNEELPAEALKWFSQFPGIFPVSGSDIIKDHSVNRWYQEALLTIYGMALHWASLSSICRQRRFPPLSSELRKNLLIESLLLQQVVFRAMLRMFLEAHDPRFEQHEIIFVRDQQYHESVRRSNVRSANMYSHDMAVAQQHLMVHAPHGSQLHGPHGPFPLRPCLVDLNQSPRHSLDLTSAESVHPRSYVHEAGAVASAETFNFLKPTTTSTDISPNLDSNTQMIASGPLQNNQQPTTLMMAGPTYQPTMDLFHWPNDQTMVLSHAQHLRQPECSYGFLQSQDQSVLGLQHHPAQTFSRPPFHYAQSVHPQIPGPTQVRRWESGQQPPLLINPNLPRLHQAHHTSPNLLQSTSEKCFVYVNKIRRLSQPLDNKCPFLQCTLFIEQAEASLIAQDIQRPGALKASRVLARGSIMYRIRCVKTRRSAEDISDETFLLSDHAWPPNTTIFLNDQAIEFRRKSIHIKDLPADVTRVVKEGQNTITVAIMTIPASSSNHYHLALESMTMTTYSAVKNSMSELNIHAARQRIMSKLEDNDPDVQALDDKLIVDLTDPFSATLFRVPVRGKGCQHDQCFDLETFLDTREGIGKSKDDPCPPDEFRCPICKGDARPDQLVVDGFFADIRKQLGAMGRLDVKAIQIERDGGWTIKEDEEISGESGDDDGRRDAAKQQASGRRHDRSASCVEVIEID